MPDPAEPLFDRQLWRIRRGRARMGAAAGPLLDPVQDSLVGRLEEIRRSFPAALVIGSGGGRFVAALRGRFGIRQLVQMEPGVAAIMRAMRTDQLLVADEEALPVREHSLDLVIGGLTLHWANDPVGVLVQIRRALRPDGLFLGAMFAGETLCELRSCLAAAEIELCGGLSARVAPMGGLPELGNLLQRAGLALPVADLDRHQLAFRDITALAGFLRELGETNVMQLRGGALTPALLRRAGELYVDRFGLAAGGIPATFEIAWLTGWAPDSAQPRPLPPGSATMRLADALGAVERSAGERAQPADQE